MEHCVVVLIGSVPNQFSCKTAAVLSWFWYGQIQAQAQAKVNKRCVSLSNYLHGYSGMSAQATSTRGQLSSAQLSWGLFPLKSYDNGVIPSTNLSLTVSLVCFFFPPHCIRIWKRVETVCPSQPITWCPRQPPVWEISPHWISPTMRNCPQTPATPLIPKKKVSVVSSEYTQ